MEDDSLISTIADMRLADTQLDPPKAPKIVESPTLSQEIRLVSERLDQMSIRLDRIESLVALQRRETHEIKSMLETLTMASAGSGSRLRSSRK